MLSDSVVHKAAEEAGLRPSSIVISRLDQAAEPIALDAGEAFYPASMIKTPLALTAYALVADGELALDRTFEVTEPNMTANDKPSPLIPGYRSPLSELIDLMITRSDNVATNMLYDIVGRERASEMVQKRYGLAGTAFYRKLSGSLPLIHDPEWDRSHMNTHPPADAAKLFRMIGEDRVPFAAALRETLERQEWNNKLTGGLLAGDVFAHKTGDTDEVTHDGGILYTQSGARYVIVVYTGMESNDANNLKFAPFMSAIRAHFG